MLKIAFLFLTIADVYHEHYWQDFFKYHEPQYSVYIHSKEPLSENSFFKSHEIESKISTTWENTMKAQIELLREALKDPCNDKFIFVSESTIPLQDFDTIYESLIARDKSIFSFCPNPHQDPQRVGTFWGYHNYQPKRILYPIPARLQYRNSQWVILSRKHAQLMVDDTKYIEMITRHICDQEHYPSTFLAIKGLLDEVANCQTTYDDWIITSSPAHPFTFTDLTEEKQIKPLIKAIQGGLYSNPNMYFFARKFEKDCDLSPLDTYLSYRQEWQ